MARYVGIEVTESQVKAVVLKTSYRSFQIEAIHRLSRAVGTEGLAVAIASISNQIGSKLDGTFTAITAQDVSIRPIEVPRAVLKRGNRVIAAELESQIPFEIDQAVVDAVTTREGDPTELLAAAAKTEKVKSVISAFRAGNIEPAEVGVGPLALAELTFAIPELVSESPILLLYGYETFADIVVLVNGTVRLARTVSAQTTPSARVRSLKQTVAAFRAAGGDQLSSAYLFGESAFAFQDAAAEALGIDLEQIRMGLPLGQISLGPNVSQAAAQLAPIALALSLRGVSNASKIDLRKGELAIARSSQIFRERAGWLAVCVLAIVTSWIFATYTRYVSAARDRDRIVEALGNVTRELVGERITDPARARRIALGTGNEGAEVDPQPLVDGFDVIGVLSSKIPDNIRHDVLQLVVQEEHIQLDGMVDTLNDRDRIVAALREFECFQTVTTGRTVRTAGDNSRQQYSLEIEMRCPERQTTTRTGTNNRTTGGTNSSSSNSGSTQRSAGGNNVTGN